MSQKSYECRQCHKMTVGYPALYRNKCLECRNLEIRTMMEKERLGRLTKTELIQENKKLQAKMRNLQDIDIYDSDISSDDSFQQDPNFIRPSPPPFQKLKMNQVQILKSLARIQELIARKKALQKKQQKIYMEKWLFPSFSKDRKGISLENNLSVHSNLVAI